MWQQEVFHEVEKTIKLLLLPNTNALNVATSKTLLPQMWRQKHFG
jgi:hypothetical protein